MDRSLLIIVISWNVTISIIGCFVKRIDNKTVYRSNLEQTNDKHEPNAVRANSFPQYSFHSIILSDFEFPFDSINLNVFAFDRVQSFQIV